MGEQKVSNFPLATSEGRKVNGEWQDHTEWHNITAWGHNAEKSISKGDRVYIEGKLKTDSYEKDGHKVYSTKVVAHRVRNLSPKKNSF